MEDNQTQPDSTKKVYKGWLEDELRDFYGLFGGVKALEAVAKEMREEAGRLFINGEDELAKVRRAMAQDMDERAEAQLKIWRKANATGERIQLFRAYKRLEEMGYLVPTAQTPDGPRDTVS